MVWLYAAIAVLSVLPGSQHMAQDARSNGGDTGFIELMEKAISLVPVMRAQQAMLDSRFDDAYVDLSAAIERDPDNPALYVLRGQVQLARYEWDASEMDYNTALGIDGRYADAYFYRGVLRYSILQTGLTLREDALGDFMRYLELAPNGTHAADAARYTESIRMELEALNGD